MKGIKSSSRVLCLNVDNGISFALQLKYNSKNPVVEKYFIIDTPFDTVADNGCVNVSDIFKENFKLACKENKITADSVVFSVNTGRIINREIVIPAVNSSKIDSLLQANASEYFPIDIQDYKMVHHVIEAFSDNTGKHLRLNVCAVPLDIIISYYSLASQLGLKVAMIDYAGNSIFQFVKAYDANFNQTHTNPNTVNVYISLSSCGTMVSFVKNGSEKLHRYLSIGYGKLLQKACDDKGVSAAGLISGDFNIAELNESGEKPLKGRTEGTSGDGLDMLGMSIIRSIDYFSNFPENANSEYKVYLVGQSCCFAGIEKLISEKIGMQVGKISPSVDKKNFKSFHGESSTLSEYGLCIGSVLQPIDFTDKRAELAAPAIDVFKDSGFQSLLLLIGGVIFAVCVAISVCLWIIPQSNNEQLKGQYKDLNEKIQQLAQSKTYYDEHEKWKDIYNEISGINGYLYTKNDKLVSFIEEFEKKMPKSFKTTDISIAEDGVSMTVTVASRVEAAYVITTLRKLESATLVSVSNSFTFGDGEISNEDYVVITDNQYDLVKSSIKDIDWLTYDMTQLLDQAPVFDYFGVPIEDYINKNGTLNHKNLDSRYKTLTDDEIRKGLNDKTIDFFELFRIKKESDISSSDESQISSVSISVVLKYKNSSVSPETSAEETAVE